MRDFDAIRVRTSLAFDVATQADAVEHTLAELTRAMRNGGEVGALLDELETSISYIKSMVTEYTDI